MDYSYYNSFLPRDPNELCRYIGDENIFRLVFDNVEIGRNYVSPLRKDSRAGCFFWESPDSRIFFIDYGNPGHTHLNPLEFIKEYYQFDNLLQTMNFVRDKFKTFIGKDIIVEDRTNQVIPERTRKIIKLYPREWSLQDKLFWSKYGISRMQLDEDRVIPLRYYQVFDGTNFETYHTSTLAYAYNFIDNTSKIYRPYDEFKWYTNATSSTIGNIENIDPEGEELIITKSYKDCRVLRNLGYKNVIWFQNEGQIPKVDILLGVINRFKKIYIFFDNDTVGKNKSQRVKSFLDTLLTEDKVYNLCIPDKYPTKDPSDFYEVYGEEQLKLTIIKIIQDVKKS